MFKIRGSILTAGLATLIFVLGLITALSLAQKGTYHPAKATAPKVGVFSLNPQSNVMVTTRIYPMEIMMRTGDPGTAQPISALALRVMLPYSVSGTTPDIDVTDVNGNPITSVVPNPVFQKAGWFFPVNKVNRQNNTISIDLAAAVDLINSHFYTSSEDVNLAKFYLKISKVPAKNPLMLTFDTSVPQGSTNPVTVMYNGSSENILKTVNNGSYTITNQIVKCGSTGAVCGTGYLTCCSPLICSNGKKGYCYGTGPN